MSTSASKMLFSSVQAPIVSLFSSTSSNPLQLFLSNTDLATNSAICLFHDNTSFLETGKADSTAAEPWTDLRDPIISDGYCLNQKVLEIASSSSKNCYIQCPPLGLSSLFSVSNSSTRDQSNDLGLKLPWMNVQIRNMQSEWSLEVGLVDQSGRLGILRLSTFQKRPQLKIPSPPNSPPILCLPLTFPQTTSKPLTSWSTVTVHLPSYIPYFSSSKLRDAPNTREKQESLGYESHARGKHSGAKAPVGPTGRYSHVAYVRVYATCRLKRIWFDVGGPERATPWEFELYGDS